MTAQITAVRIQFRMMSALLGHSGEPPLDSLKRARDIFMRLNQ